MTQPLEENLLPTFRLFVIMRLILMTVFMTANGSIVEHPVGMLINIAITASLILYLNIESLQRWLGRVYLPFGIGFISVHLILEQRLVQLRLAQTDLNFRRGMPAILEAFTLPGIENATIPLLFTLASTALLFVPLVLLSWQYRFRDVLSYIVSIAMIDISLIALASQYVRFDIPIEGLGLIVRTVAFLIVGYTVTRIMYTQREQRLSLTLLNRDLVAYATTREQLIVSQERNRLARELHDTLAHTLSAVTVKLNAVEILWDNDQNRAKTMLEEVIETLNDGNAETRRALQDLRASPLDDMGLVLAVQHLGQTAAQRGNFVIDMQMPEHELQVSADAEQTIYRITQEALANIVEHAHAQQVTLSLLVENGQLRLKIKDDGIGFEQDQIDDSHNFGILGMQERCRMVGGILSIDSQPQAGTNIQLEIKV